MFLPREILAANLAQVEEDLEELAEKRRKAMAQLAAITKRGERLDERRNRLAVVEGESLSSVLRDQLTQDIYKDGNPVPRQD